MDGLDVSRVGADGGLTGYDPGRLRERDRIRVRRPSLWAKLRRRALFLLIVVAPTAVTAVYYIGYASDQYVSEAQFVVRGVNQAPSTLSTLLSTATGTARTQDDTYAVQDYMLSRDAVSELTEHNDLRGVFNRPEADALARFPRTFLPGANSLWGNSNEHFYDYYQHHVEVDLDSTTGVTSLKVRTFRADDSRRVAQALLQAGERLVNRMNDRQRENALGDARNEVKLAEARVQAVAADIAAFRNKEEVLDPNKQSMPILQAIQDLKTQLVKAKISLAQVQATSPRSPLISDYQQRIAALQFQIDEASKRVTGNDQSLVGKMTTFDLLSLQREFAEKQLASATASLEQARINAQRQQLYLDTIVAPNEADYPAYPRKIASIALVFCGLLGAYALLSLLAAGAREHKIV